MLSNDPPWIISHFWILSFKTSHCFISREITGCILFHLEGQCLTYFSWFIGSYFTINFVKDKHPSVCVSNENQSVMSNIRPSSCSSSTRVYKFITIPDPHKKLMVLAVLPLHEFPMRIHVLLLAYASVIFAR